MMDPTAQRILVVGLVGALLTVARRWRNEDETAGLGVAGWTVGIIVLLALFT